MESPASIGPPMAAVSGLPPRRQPAFRRSCMWTCAAQPSRPSRNPKNTWAGPSPLPTAVTWHSGKPAAAPTPGSSMASERAPAFVAAIGRDFLLSRTATARRRLPEPEEAVEVEESMGNDQGECATPGGVVDRKDQELEGKRKGAKPAVIEVVRSLEK